MLDELARNCITRTCPRTSQEHIINNLIPLIYNIFTLSKISSCILLIFQDLKSGASHEKVTNKSCARHKKEVTSSEKVMKK